MKRTFFSLLLLFFVFVSGVVLGSEILNFKDLWGSPVAELRFFRMLGALFIGGALSLSGMVFQAVLRNPLAEPYTLGVSAGSGVGAAAAFITGLHAVSVYSVPLAALAGALVTVLFVLRISRAGGSEKLLLSGVIAGTICSSVLMFLLSVARSQAQDHLVLGDLVAAGFDRRLDPLPCFLDGLISQADNGDRLLAADRRGLYLHHKAIHTGCRHALYDCSHQLSASSLYILS